jgi:hypothetical protein
LGGIFLLIAATGIGFIFWKRKKKNPLKFRPFFFMLIFIYALYLCVFHLLSNFDLSQELFLSVTSRFWQLPLIFVLLFAALALNQLSLKYNSPYLTILPVLLIGLQIGLHYNERDRSQDKIFVDWGMRFLNSLPANSVVLSKGDINLNILKYIQGSMHFRKDIKVLDQELLKTDWYAKWVAKNYPEIILPHGHLQRFPTYREAGSYTLDELISLNIDHYEIYKIMEKDFESKIGSYPLRPMGKLWQVLKAPEAGAQLSFDYNTYMSEHKRRLFNFIEICRYPKQTGVWERLISVTFQRSLEFTQFYLFELVKSTPTTPFGQQVIRDNIEWGEIMLKNCSELNPFVYKNLGLFYFHLANKTPEQTKRLKEVWQTFVREDESKDQSLPWIKSVIATL